jgi:hypothetical protein
MTAGKFGRGVVMNAKLDCKCSILNAREERLLDDESRVQVRLVCNRCGTILDAEVLEYSKPQRVKEVAEARESEAAEG